MKGAGYKGVAVPVDGRRAWRSSGPPPSERQGVGSRSRPMARRNVCVSHTSCDCVHVERVLDEADERGALKRASSIARDLQFGALILRKLGPLFEGRAPRIQEMADDLEDVVAYLQGETRYTVTLYHGTVYAEDEQEAIMRARRDETRRNDHEVEIDHRPLVEETDRSGPETADGDEP